MTKFLTLFILSLIFVSCSGKKREQTKVVYTASLIGGVSFSGSLAIWGSNDHGDNLAIPFGTTSTADTINIPNGNWTFFAIGWEGANNLEGSTKCGQSSATLNGGESTINLTLNAVNCSSSNFSNPSHLSGNQFLPLKIIGCFNPGALASASTCSNSNKADISSVKVKIESNTLDPSKTYSSIHSECFDEDSATSGVHNTPLTLPTAPGLNFPFTFVVEAYSDTGCATLSEEIQIKDSMLAFTSTHETYTDSTNTELFLISNNQGSAGVPTPTGLTMVTASPGNSNTPSIQISNLTAANNIEIYTDAACTTLVHSQTIGATTETFVISNTPLATDGTYNFYAIQDSGGVDSVCSSASDAYDFDSTAPAAPSGLTLTTALNNNNAVIDVSGLEIGATVEIHLDAGCSSLQTSFVAGATTDSGTISGMTDNAYTAYAVQTDPAGNQSPCSSANATFTIDTVAPTQATSLTLNTPATSPGNDATPSIDISFAEVNADVELHTDATCTGLVGTQTSVTSSTTITASSLAEGLHTFYAKIIDQAGNSSCSSVSVNYSLDTTVPSVTGLSNDAGVYNTYTWTWGCDETCTYDYDISQSAVPAFPNTFSATTTDSVVSGDGTFYIHVRAKDAAGNISATESVTVEIDNTSPSYDTTKIPYYDEILYTVGSTVKVYWSGFSDNNLDTYDALVYSNSSCSTLVGQYNLGSSSPVIIPNTFANGNYWVKVKAIDLAGNETDSACSKMYAKVNTAFSSPAWTQFDNGTFIDAAPSMGAKAVVSMISGPPKAIVFGGYSGTPITNRTEFRPIGGIGSVSVYANAGGQAYASFGIANQEDSFDFYVFGGMTQAGTLHSGANLFNKYTVNTPGATGLSTVNAPSSRSKLAMVMSATKVCVWGGYINNAQTTTTDDGACYDISGDTWTTMSGSPLTVRANHVAEWVGDRMCIWGGNGDGGSPPVYDDGACYNPTGNTWNTMSASPLEGRTSHESVWTGKEMCIWGGENAAGASYENGACYDPVGNTWRMIGGSPPSLGTIGFNLLWTGARMCVVGGHKKYTSNAQEAVTACWSPIYNNWQTINNTGFPASIKSTGVFIEDDICLISGYSNAATPSPVSTTSCVKVR